MNCLIQQKKGSIDDALNRIHIVPANDIFELIQFIDDIIQRTSTTTTNQHTTMIVIDCLTPIILNSATTIIQRGMQWPTNII